MSLATPFPRSYWVVPGLFLAGNYPGNTDPEICVEKMRKLLDCGIRTVVNLQDENELNHENRPFPDYGSKLDFLASKMGEAISLHRMSIENYSIPETGVMEKILDTIDSSISKKRPVYVHCWGE